MLEKTAINVRLSQRLWLTNTTLENIYDTQYSFPCKEAHRKNRS